MRSTKRSPAPGGRRRGSQRRPPRRAPRRSLSARSRRSGGSSVSRSRRFTPGAASRCPRRAPADGTLPPSPAGGSREPAPRELARRRTGAPAHPLPASPGARAQAGLAPAPPSGTLDGVNPRGPNVSAGAIIVVGRAWFLRSVPELLVLDGPRLRPGEIAVFAFVAGAAMLAGFIILVRQLRCHE
jgi:hypothetical protein